MTIPHLLEAARQAVRQGDWPAAREFCRRLLEEPGMRYEGFDLSAAVALACGQPRAALELAEAAIGEAAGEARGYLRRGGARLALGDLAGAEADFEHAVTLDPHSAAGHQALGLTLLGGRPAAAEASFERALALHPEGDPAAASSHWGLARARLALGRPEAARRELERALAIDEGHQPARRELAWLACAAFDWVAAERHLRAILEAEKKEAADPALRAALVDVLRHLGRLDEALRLALAVPAEGRMRQMLARLAADRRLPIRRLEPELREKLARELAAAFGDLAIDPQDLVAATAELVRLDPGCDAFLAALADPAAAAPPEARGAAWPLLLRALEKALITDLELERRLLSARRGLLASGTDGGPEAWRLEAGCALALQAALGGYLHPLEPAEQEAADSWQRRLEEHFAARSDEWTEIGWAAALTALARPLLPLAEAAGLGPADLEALAGAAPPLERLIARLIREPALERSLAEAFRSGPWREDASSAPVRRQYESYPYPCWRGLRLDSEPRPPAEVLRRLFPRLALPEFLAQPCRVLVAGCGTGQQAVAAAGQFRASSILAIDLSAESLAYCRRMADIYATSFPDFTRIELARADLLELKAADGLFDLVLCTGVLHHLEDPEAGWRHLRSLVRPGGLLKVGLYSRLARRQLAALQSGLGPAGAADSEVMAARRRLAADPQAATLWRFIDFYSLVGFRDLLFHPREHCFSLPEIATMLERLELRFLGFELPRELAGELYSRLFPLDPARQSLENWAALESAWPDTFADLYQIWCQVPEEAQSASQ